MINIGNDKIRSNNVNIDANYGPYESLASAHAALEDNEKNQIGVTVGVIENNTIVEYWYQGGITKDYLIPKAPDMSNKQDVINENNLLSADLIDDTNSTNKFVSSAEKTTWNGKQNALSNTQLADIAKGGTALQPSSTLGLLKNDGTVDTETQGKAANAIQMPAGASADKVLGYENDAVAWVDKPQDGKKGDKGDKGKDAVNPFKGYYPSGVSKPATGAVGDYIYAPPSDSQSTATATIWHYDSTQTPPWTDTEIDVSAVVGVEFGSGQAVNEVNIKDLDGQSDSTATGVLSAEAGKAMNTYSSETEVVVLDGSSPYHVSNITTAFISVNFKIESNADSAGYGVALFQLPAGNYRVTYLRNITAPVVYLATINSAENFVLGGDVNTIIIRGDTAVRNEPVTVPLEEETYIVLAYSTYPTAEYDLWCKLEKVNENVVTVKDKVAEVDEAIEEMQPIVDSTATAVDKLELLKTKETTVEFQLENDYDFFTNSYRWAKIGQYTKILTEDTPFNVVRINRIKSVNCNYKIYITNAGVGYYRDTPAGVIGASGKIYTLVKEGTLNESFDGYGDIEIALDDFCVCPAGCQVVVYMVSNTTAQIDIKGAADGYGNPERTSNRALICTGDDPFGTSNWIAGTYDNSTNKGYFNVALTLILKPLFVSEDGLNETLGEMVPPIVDENIGLNLDIIIPNTVYAIVGTELNIWNDNISLSVDKGLMSPMNYQVRWSCNKGLVTDRCFRFKPTSSDVGNHSCTCYIYDVRGKFVASKTFTIKVVAKNALVTAKKIVHFGDSIGSETALALDRNFRDTNRFTGTKPKMLGTNVASWEIYASIQNANIGDVYMDDNNSHTFEVFSIVRNTQDSITGLYLHSYPTSVGELTSPNGTLSRVSGSGDATITYTAVIKRSTNREAVGGYKWSNYATAGAPGYRIYVSGVTSLSLGAVYSDGSHNFEIIEINITEGTGNCLLARYYTNPGTLIMPGGTLSKVSGSGDSTVPYTGAFKESANPLWNDTTNQLDITQYKQTLVNLGQLSSTDDKIDAVSFQFGGNESFSTLNLDSIRTYISDLYNCFVGDNPDCIFIVGLTTSGGNDVNGLGANYGATQNNKLFLENVYKIKKLYLTLVGSEFPNLRLATPNLYLDRYYGFAFGTRQISDRYTTTEQYHTNYVHPTTSGYKQIADAYLACYVAVLGE